MGGGRKRETPSPEELSKHSHIKDYPPTLSGMK